MGINTMGVMGHCLYNYNNIILKAKFKTIASLKLYQLMFVKTKHEYSNIKLTVIDLTFIHNFNFYWLINQFTCITPTPEAGPR